MSEEEIELILKKRFCIPVSLRLTATNLIECITLSKLLIIEIHCNRQVNFTFQQAVFMNACILHAL